MAQRRLQVVLDLDTGRYTGRLNDAASRTRAFHGSVDAGSRAVRQFGTSFDNLNNKMSTPLSKLRDYVLILGNIRLAILNVRDIAVGWVGSLLQQSAQVERLTILMKGLSSATTDLGRNQEATKNLQSLFQMARETGFAVDALADAFVKLRSGGLDPTDGSLKSLADAVAYFGGTSDVMHRASIAIQQMSGKGVISMEELRQQLGEAVPTAMADMARAAGMALPEFTKLVSKGVVQAGPALELMFQEFERLYAGAGSRMANTLTGQMAQFKTNVMELATYFTGLAQTNTAEWQAYVAEQQKLLDEGKITVEQFDELTKKDGGLFQGAADALRKINEAMQSGEAREFVAGVGSSVNQMAAAFMQFASAASGSGGAILAVFQGLADAVSITFNVLTTLSEAFKSLGVFGGAAIKALVIGFIAVKATNAITWMLGGLAQSSLAFRGLAASATTAHTALGATFQSWSVAATNQANILRNQIALQNGRTRYLNEQAAAARFAATTTQNLALSLKAEENALRQKVAVQQAAIQAARQQQVVAQANIATGVRMSQSITQLKAAKSAETLATIRLAQAERDLAAAKSAATVATQRATAAVAVETAAVARATVAKGAATVAQRALSVAVTAGAAAMRFFGAAINLALGPLGLIALALYAAAEAAGVFESAADKATAAAMRMRQGIADANDMAAVNAGIQQDLAQVSKIDKWLEEGGIRNGYGKLVPFAKGQRENLEKRRDSLTGRVDSWRSDKRIAGLTANRETADRSVSTVRSEWDETRARNGQAERSRLAVLEQQRRRNEISQEEFQKKSDDLREKTNAKNTAWLNAKISQVEGYRDQAASIGQDTTARDLTLKGLYEMRDGASATSVEVENLRGQLTGAGQAGSQAGSATAAKLTEAQKAAKALATEQENARSGYDDQIARQAGDIAKLREQLKGGEGLLAEFEAEFAAGLHDHMLPDQLAKIREQLAEIERLESEKDWGRSMRQLRKEVAQVTDEANSMWRALQADDTGRAFDKYKDSEGVRSKFADKFEAAAGNPERIEELNNEVERYIQNLQLIDAAEVTNDWRVMAEDIQISLMAEDEARQANFEREMARQQALIDEIRNNAAMTVDERILAEERFNNWRRLRQQQMDRENESSTVKMARDWAKLGQNIDRALGGALDSFVDGMFDAEFNFGDFAKGIIKEIVKIIIKAMIAYAILSAIGMANNSSGQPVSFGDFLGGQISAGFSGNGNQSNPNAIGFPIGHTGAVIGRIHSGMARVSPDVFTSARTYHSGTNNIGGRALRPGEVPFIGMEGEAVLTQEHQQMISNKLRRGSNVEVPPVTVNVINNSGQQLEAEQGEPEFNGKEMIVNVIVEAAQKQGPLRDVLSSMAK